MDDAWDSVDQRVVKSAKYGGRKRKPRKQVVNPQNLERWAIRHLDRFGSSASNLRWVLLRRVRRIERRDIESDAHGK